MLVQEPVQAAIWHCLNNYDYSDAIFLAERLRAEVESEETLWLLATCYYRSGKPSQAYHILKNTSSPQCRLLLAKCCVDLQKLTEAERVLCGGVESSRPRAVEEVASEFGDAAGFALLLLAAVNCATDRHHRANEAYRGALKANPLLWSAFEGLCRAGDGPDPASTFSATELPSLAGVTGANPVINYVNSHHSNISCVPNKVSSIESLKDTPIDETPLAQPLSFISPPVEAVNMGGTCMSGVRAFTPENSSPLPLPAACRPRRAIRYRSIFSGAVSPLTPSFGIIPLDINSCDSTPLNTLTEVNEQKVTNKRVVVGGGRVVGGMRVADEAGTPSRQTQPNPPRRSTRLFSNNCNVKENSKSPSRGKFVTPKSPSRKGKGNGRAVGKGRAAAAAEENRAAPPGQQECRLALTTPPPMPPPASPTLTNTPSLNSANARSTALALQRHSLEGLVRLLRELGWAYIHLSRFECKKAIHCLGQIPPHHRATGWVMSLIARAYFEDHDYKHAVKYFAEVRSREPERTQMMEIYSTALWHLGKDYQLSALAQDLLQADRHCPETWCAAGNCMSLQKEHDAAIKFFQRAVQIDPKFVYAYTLLGHEYVVTDELDKGISCFRNAVRLDPRHYNAWYGIGTIYSKQERFQLAELHYKRALTINPRSCVLLCHIGVTQHGLQRREDALATLNEALALEPGNALCKFHRASVLTTCGMHQEAIEELEQLKELVPKESMVYYLAGKVHKKLGNTHLALMHFSWATDLNPKGATLQMKEAIDPGLTGASPATTAQASAHSSSDIGEESASDDLLQQSTNNQDADALNSDFSF